MSTQIERNAEVVADLAGADWQMAYVIACSVEKGKAGRPSGNVRNSGDSKVSIIEFARKVKAAAFGAQIMLFDAYLMDDEGEATEAMTA